MPYYFNVICDSPEKDCWSEEGKESTAVVQPISFDSPSESFNDVICYLRSVGWKITVEDSDDGKINSVKFLCPKHHV